MASLNNEKLSLLDEFIQSVVQKHCRRIVTKVQPLQYDDRTSSSYIVSISGAADTVELVPKSHLGSSELAAGPTTLILRVYDKDRSTIRGGFDPQNEAAAMSLTREALKPLGRSLVPAVYGWGLPQTGGKEPLPGWILLEHMPGEVLAKHFPGLHTDKQEYLLGEIADILKHIRAFKLPDSINGFGGLTFDVDGREVVNKAPVTSEGVAGPCETYGDLYSSYLQRQLQLVDQCPLVEDDWMNEELRERMDGFAREGLEPLIKSKTKPRQTLVHGNFETDNILFDPKTKRVTALLSFQTAHIASQAEEYFLSLRSLGWQILAPDEDGDGDDDEGELAALRSCLLRGFDKAPKAVKAKWISSKSSPNLPINWKVAALFDSALQIAGVERPMDIEGMAEMASVFWFVREVYPVALAEKLQTYLKDGEQENDYELSYLMDRTSANLEWYLDKWGFTYEGLGVIACEVTEGDLAAAANRPPREEEPDVVLGVAL